MEESRRSCGQQFSNVIQRSLRATSERDEESALRLHFTEKNE